MQHLNLEKKAVTVIYLAGSGRSGSTLLELSLNNVLGQPATGELIHLWHHSLDEVKCGCGEIVSDCEFWGSVFNKMPISKDFFNDVALLKKEVLRWRYLPWLIFPDLAPKQYKERFKKFVEYYEQLYLALASSLNSQLVVDASKNVLMLFMFNQFKKIEFKVIHLVRDPRGVVYSWRFRKKVNPAYFKKESYMHKIPLAKIIGLWWFNFLLVSMQCKRFVACVSVTYDNFVLHPKATLQYLCASLGIEGSNFSVIENRKMLLDNNHTISGNPLRFKRGEITIQKDDEWRMKMPLWAYWSSTFSTWPWLLMNKKRK